MATHNVTREEAQEAWDAYQSAGSKEAAARALGMAKGTFRNRLTRGADLYGIGNPDIAAPAPAGQIITGTSTLQNAQTGETVLQWVKTKSDPTQDCLRESLISVFEGYKGLCELAPKVKGADKDLLTVYNIADHHLGLYAWGEETGEDYDVEIGERILRDAMRELVASTPSSETAIILNLGDFFHSDNQSNQTARSGNPLDVDSRWFRVMRTGVQLFIECVEMALQKHKRVIVRCLPGNHDEHSALMLTIALSLAFDKNKRADVAMDPSRFFTYEFGKVMISATHGDMAQMKDMPGIMAALWSDVWGRSKYRYGYTGHVHHNAKTKLEMHGCQCECFQTLASKDAWHFAKGYTSGRSMAAITHHKERGEYVRNTVSL